MSSSSTRFAASISRTLNPRRYFVASSSHRNPKSTSPFSERTLSTLTESPSTSSSSQAQGEQTRRWSRWLLFLPGAITFGLGTWQIFRRLDKIELLEYRRNRLELEPLKWNSILSSSSGDVSSLEFRRVICEGVFDDSKSVFVGPRSRSISGVTENGYYVITPLMPIMGNRESMQSPVLVNRGWVPRSWRDKALSEQTTNVKPPHNGENEGRTWWKFWSKKPKSIKDHDIDVSPVKVVGVIRGSEKPSIFVPSNDPSTCQWFYVDVPMIACACGLPEDTVYIEDINEKVNPSKPYPLPKDVNSLIRSSVMPLDHLNYSLTWYSLSAAVTFMAVKRLKQKKSLR